MPVTVLHPARRRYTSGYADRVHNPRAVSRVMRTMIEQYPAFADQRSDAPDIDFGAIDTVVGTGLSGALIVPALARSLQRAGYDVDYLLVRKDSDGTHSAYQVEGRLGSRWVFVDDVIASGRTLRRCIKKIRAVRSDAELAAVFLYGGGNAPAGHGGAKLCAAAEVARDYGWSFERFRELSERRAFEMARPRV